MEVEAAIAGASLLQDVSVTNALRLALNYNRQYSKRSIKLQDKKWSIIGFGLYVCCFYMMLNLYHHRDEVP